MCHAHKNAHFTVFSIILICVSLFTVKVPHLVEIVTVVLLEVVVVVEVGEEVGVAPLGQGVDPSLCLEEAVRSRPLAQGQNHRTMNRNSHRY